LHTNQLHNEDNQSVIFQ